jgi:hypothetical protein
MSKFLFVIAVVVFACIMTYTTYPTFAKYIGTDQNSLPKWAQSK